MTKIAVRILSLCLGFYSLEVFSSDFSELLDRESWRFSPEEIKSLNSVSTNVMQRKVHMILESATGNVYDDGDKLIAYQIIDLNFDKNAELIVRVDVSGRGKSRDLTIVSRQSGTYYYDYVPADGLGLELWRQGRQTLLVGSEPVFQRFQVDPTVWFPRLFAWTGTNCVDVSKENKIYYETRFLPEATNAITQYANIKSLQKEEGKQGTLIELMGWALSIERLNVTFVNTPVFIDAMKKVDNLISTFQLEKDEEPALVKKFLQIQKRIQKQIIDDK